MLSFYKSEDETYFECARRYASEYSLEYEVERAYKSAELSGYNKRESCYYALCEWDLLDFEGEVEEDDT